MNPINEMVMQQPMLSAANIYGYVKGIYCLTSLVVKIDKYGNPYARIKLSDALSSISINCFMPHALSMLNEPNVPVAVELTVSTQNNVFVYTCTHIELVSFEQYVAHAGIYGLPLAVLNKNFVHKRFYNILDNIYSQNLLQFLAQSLLQRQTCINYCLCPASLAHHHNYAGGLVEHSIEVAESILENDSLSDAERQIGLVAALVHDIGKTRTMTPDLNRTSLGYFVDHDDLTLEICAYAMHELEKGSEIEAVQLRHALTCKVPGSRYGFEAKTRVATTLQQADSKSANQSPNYFTTMKCVTN